MFDINELRGSTYATIRAAFNSSSELIQEYGDAGSCNVTSILTKIIQDVGRFSERWSSDALYTMDHIRDMAGKKFHVTEDQPFDEIMCFGIRQDGVDHNSYIMCTLAKSRDMIAGYVYPKKSYRRILAVRCRAWLDKPLHCTRVDFSLRDVTDAFHSIEKADIADNGIDAISLPDASRVSPEPQERYRVDKEDVRKLAEKGFKRFDWAEADENQMAEMRKNGCQGPFQCLVINGYHDEPAILPDEKGTEICRLFLAGPASIVQWAQPGYEYWTDAHKLLDDLRTARQPAMPVIDTSGSMM